MLSYGKSVVLPKRVDRPYMYYSDKKEEVVNGYKHIKLGINDTLIARFRKIVPSWVGEELMNFHYYNLNL